MQSALLFIAAATTAHLAVAQVLDLGVVEPPVVTQPAALVARQDDQCATSVMLELMGPAPEDLALQDWIVSVTHPLTCTVTAPAELSDEYTSWANQMTEWAQTAEKKAAETEEVCGFAYLTVSFTGNCEEPERTVLFTDSDGSTSTAREEKLSMPTGLKVNSGPRSHGVLGAGMALAVFIAVAVAM